MIARLNRYLRLFGFFVAFSFMRSFEFRFDFFMRILMDVMYYGVAISFFRILFLHTPELGGWNEDQMMIFVATYCLVDAINMTLFANNFWQFSFIVNRGDLDYYLLRPVSSLFFLSLRDFAASSAVNLLIAFGILIWAIARFPDPISFQRMLIYFVLVLNGNLIFYCVQMLVSLLNLLTHAPTGAGHLSYNLMKFGERPDRIYSGRLRLMLVSLVPFAIISSFPTRILVEGVDGAIVAHALGVSTAFFTFLLWAWKAALSRYSSASS